MRRLLAAMALSGASAVSAAQDFAYLLPGAALPDGVRVVDARPREACLERSVAGAACLPAAELAGAHGRLPSWRDITWLLGTVGLTGDESVLVVGEDAAERDFVAGILYLAGQREVQVSLTPLGALLGRGASAAPGAARAFSRVVVFAAPMRDELIVLRHELQAILDEALLLDGRDAAEYWGERVRAARGGHLPGAVSLPALELRASRGALPLPAAHPVAYGHDARDGVAYFTALRAGRGIPAQVYPGGWAEWASDGTLPADAASHAERAAPAPLPEAPGRRAPPTAYWGALAAAVIAAFAAGVLLARRGRA